MGISKLQGLWVTCNPHKFEIPALWFPYKPPVNPCKHLQCIFLKICKFNHQKKKNQNGRIKKKLAKISLIDAKGINVAQTEAVRNKL